MKIVLYSNIFFSDCDFPLVRAFQKLGVEVQYYIQVVKGACCGGVLDLRRSNLHLGITCAKKIDSFRQFEDYIDLDSVYVIYRTPDYKNPINLLTYFALCNKIRKFKPNRVHITEALGFVETPLYIYKNIMAMTVHDPIMHSGEHNSSSDRKRRIAFKAVPTLILLNRTQEKEFVDLYKLDSKKIAFNKLGVYDCLRFLSREKTSVSEKYILFFGHFSPYKGIDVLCDAMKIVHSQHPEISCVIAGKGNLPFDFSPYEKKYSIKLINKFIDVKDLANLIKNSLFVVCPYKDATQSGVIASAFALNKPVIATSVGGLSESVLDGVTGKLIPPCDVKSLADSIIELLENNLVLEEMSASIKKMYEQTDLSWEKIAAKYIDIYKY